MYSLPSDLPRRISRNEFYVLLVLAQGDAHPYKIKHKIREYSKGSIKLGDGTVYNLIKRMAGRGLIELGGEYPTDDSGRTTMHYSLGHHGRTALRYELERLQHAIKVAESAGLLEIKT